MLDESMLYEYDNADSYTKHLILSWESMLICLCVVKVPKRLTLRRNSAREPHAMEGELLPLCCWESFMVNYHKK